jgi:hypothetical protein
VVDGVAVGAVEVVECQEGVVPRAVCAVPGDAVVADGANEQGRRRVSPEQRCSGEGAASRTKGREG